MQLIESQQNQGVGFRGEEKVQRNQLRGKIHLSTRLSQQLQERGLSSNRTFFDRTYDLFPEQMQSHK